MVKRNLTEVPSQIKACLVKIISCLRYLRYLVYITCTLTYFHSIMVFELSDVSNKKQVVFLCLLGR